ncbi:MAG TPA: hypothetical protein VLG71_01085 [Candidatus Limnocylindria bacterium]|nr:hypothetical protein [Candidatus Limnocylindria bacterium]
MNESKVRPTKKQKELLSFIEEFIKQHGYSPSYREIMDGLGYTSVATVALHVNSLIKRGHIKKRDNEARSLEVVNMADEAGISSNKISEDQEKWLVEKVEYYFKRADQDATVDQASIDQLYVLIGALKVLGLDGAAHSFMPRLAELKRKAKTK